MKESEALDKIMDAASLAFGQIPEENRQQLQEALVLAQRLRHHLASQERAEDAIEKLLTEFPVRDNLLGDCHEKVTTNPLTWNSC